MADNSVELGTTGDSPAGIDIGAQLGGVLPSGLMDNLTELRRGQSAETDKTTREMDQDIDADQAKIHRWHAATEATGVEAANYPKWNEEEQSKKFSHDPIEAFGSLGSVVGILASAFTRAPMENAFNASAAAMNAIKAGDDEAYKRAHTAWKDNLDLTFKRHDLMRTEYQDAISLLTTDMRAGEAKLKTAAMRYGDKKLLALSEAGMDKELFEYLDAQNKAVEGLRKIKLEGIEDNLKSRAYDGIAKGIDDAAEQTRAQGGQVDPTEIAGRKLEAFNRVYRADKATPQQQIMGTYFAQHPLATADEAADFALKKGIIHTYRPSNDDQVREMLRNELGREPTAEEFAKAKRALTGIDRKLDQGDRKIEQGDRKLDITEARNAELARHAARNEELSEARGGTAQQRADEAERHNREMEKLRTQGGNTQLTPARRIEADVQKARAKWIEEGFTDEEIAKKSAELSSRLKTADASISGNRKDDIERRIDQIKVTTDHVDRALGLLKKHNAISGIGGSILRRGETVVSIMGSKSTDWHEFESEVATIKQLEPRILLDAQGRPLAGENELREKIVRGLGAGDTKKITVDRFMQLRKDLQEAKAMAERRKGSGEPDKPATEGGGEKPKPWESDPIVKP